MELQFLIALFLLGTVSSSDVKSSLTFVIDDTESMSDDIKEVTNAVDAILDTVAKSSSSPIEEYVLVTFNNDTRLVIKTKDKTALKKELGNINTGGGGDFCPEKSLTGIELALNESREGSLLYVFTDASAEDYKNSAKVAALSQKKGVQVVFLLTGVCENDTNSQDYLVYHDIAKASNGQVFHLKKNEIGKILKYVEESVKSRKDIILSKTLQAYQFGVFNVTVDEDLKDVVIAVSGNNARLNVLDSSGAEAPTTNITRLETIAVVKIADPKPGVYRVEVGSTSITDVVVSASSSVHFQHGFSIIAPSGIEDTATRPVPDQKSYVSIKLNGSHVKLENVQLLRLDDSVISEHPLTLVDKDKQFYTTEPVETPKHIFKLAINGYDTRKKSNVTRYSSTPIEPQSTIEQPIEKSPVVTIDEAPSMNAEFFKPLTLKCKVSGYPKVDIIWQSDDASAKLDYEKASIVELPYDFVSVLKIPKVEKNVTYSCQAINAAGEGTQNVTVLTEEKHFIEVEAKDVTIEYQKSGNITCNVNAHPPANVTWYRGRSLLKPDGNFNVSANGTVVTVKSMDPKWTGKYFCVAKNDAKKVVKLLKVNISGAGPPKIDKSIYTVNARVETEVIIRCLLIEAVPNATLSWSFKNAEEEISLNETSDTIRLDYVQISDAGTYSCKAENAMGVDYHGIELIVEYSPDISEDMDTSVTVIEGSTVTLDCAADGVPKPSVIWTRNGALLHDKTRHTFYANGSIGFSAILSDAGSYNCEASNIWGRDQATVELEVIVPVALKSPGKTHIEQVEGLPLNLECKAGGPPPPNITWFYRKTNKSDAIKVDHNTAGGDLRFASIHHGQSGEYTCVAVNAGGSKNITYTVSVTAAPTIISRMKQYDGVIGDMYLRVPCDATGNPKPEVLWTFHQQNISSDTQWYLVGDDGSLIIKKVDESAAGVYTCTATNKYGTVSERFQVSVYDHPIDRSLSIMIEEGKTENIACSVPHRPKIDRVNWFKDGLNISSGLLENVNQSHAGTYTCRVSGPDRPPQTGSTTVEVGFKPRFVYKGNNNIRYEYGRRATLDCTAAAVPKPLVTWLHDSRTLSITEFKYEFYMNNEGQKGRYTCAVNNQYGYVQQDFIIE